MASIILVHGTGVRKESYEGSCQEAGQKLAAPDLGLADLGLQLVECFWGGALGTELQAGAKSVPQVDRARGEQLEEQDYELALWSLLYEDPFFELRALGLSCGQAAGLLDDETPYELLAPALQNLAANESVRQQVAECRLTEVWDEAQRSLLGWQELHVMLGQPAADLSECRLALARALTAQALALQHARDSDRMWWPGGAQRDALVVALLVALGGEQGAERGARERIKGLLTGLAANVALGVPEVARWGLSRWHRAIYPAVGDILFYQAKGAGISNFIRAAIEAAPPPVILLAHSLGGIACVDLLIAEVLPQVKLLITAGSQAPLLYEFGALRTLDYGAELPEKFPPWLNLYDPQDYLSFTAGGVFPPNLKVRDAQVQNGQPFPFSHITYWSNDAVWREIRKEILALNILKQV